MTARILFVAGFLLLGMGWLAQREARGKGAAEEALRASRVALEAAQTHADSMDAIRLALGTALVTAEAEVARTRERSQDAERLALQRQREASARVATASATLRATLDSAQAVALDSLEAAHRQEVVALVDQLSERGVQLVAADSAYAIERRRNEALFASYEAQRGRADAAEAALAAAIRLADADEHWYTPLVGPAKAAGFFLAGYGAGKAF